jgi:hypothetical protein
MLLDSHGNGVDGAVASLLEERGNGVSELQWRQKVRFNHDERRVGTLNLLMSVLVMPYLQMISRSCSRRKGACESPHALNQFALSLAQLGKRDTTLTQHEGFESGAQVSGYGGGNAGKGAGKTSSAKCHTHGAGTGTGAAQQHGKREAQSRRN